MAGGLFDKALATWEAMFGTDDLRAQLDDERSETLMLVERIADLEWKLSTTRKTNEALEAEIAALRTQIATLEEDIAARARVIDGLRRHIDNHADLGNRHGNTVRRQYSDVDAWKEAAGDMV